MTPADHAAREGALVVPRPDWGTLSVSGSERLSWLQGLLTSDVEHLAEGAAAWGLVLTKPGKIQADVITVAVADRVLLALPFRVQETIADALSRFLVMEDADLEIVSSGYAWAALHGPRAVDVAASLAVTLGGSAAPVDVTGLGGAVLVVPAARAAELASAASGVDGVVVATDEDWRRLAVERLVPELGVDMGPEMNPHEASLDRRCVSWTKGCYLGQEAVCMQDMRGKVKRRLVILRLDGAALPEAGAEVTDPAGAVVGKITRAVTSDVLGGHAALALVAAASSEAGARLRAAGQPAEVVLPA